MGFLFILLLERFDTMGPQLRSLLLIGFLGGYTTFSSFSIETLNLFENGAYLSGTLNILFSIILCISATWLGVIGGKQL
jgi:CrcB protein